MKTLVGTLGIAVVLLMLSWWFIYFKTPFPESLITPVKAEATVRETIGDEASWRSYDNMEHYWEAKPELRPLIKQAMSDGRLTTREALHIYHTEQRNSLVKTMEEKPKKEN